MKKLTLVFDLDAIVIDLLRTWITWLNKTHGYNLTIDDITQYNMHDVVPCGNDVYKFFTKERYRTCPVIPGAAWGLSYLQGAGHKIIVATATAGDTGSEKLSLLHKAAPWFHEDDLYVGKDKYKHRGDVFVDDAPKNIYAYRDVHPDTALMTIEYPYNRELKDVVHVFAKDYRQPENAWLEIVRGIQTIAGDEVLPSWHSMR